MFRLSAFVFGVLLSLQSFAIVVKPAVIDVFDLRPVTADSSRAVSFANWFNATAGDYPYTKTLYASLGLDVDQLLENFDLPANKRGIESLRREFDFYSEQQTAFKTKVEKYVKRVFPEMITKIEDTFQNSDIDIVVYRTSDSYEFLIGLRARPEMKAKLNKIKVGTSNAWPTMPMVFYKSNRKPKKVTLLGDFMFQAYDRTDDRMVSIKVVCGDFSGVSERAGMPTTSAAMPAMPAPAAPLALAPSSGGGGSSMSKGSQGPGYAKGMSNRNSGVGVDVQGGFSINIFGGISTSAEIGKSVVDAIAQYQQVYGPVNFATI